MRHTLHLLIFKDGIAHRRKNIRREKYRRQTTMPLVERRREGSSDNYPTLKQGGLDPKKIETIEAARKERFNRNQASQDEQRPLQPDALPGFSIPKWDGKKSCWTSSSTSDSSKWKEWDAEKRAWKTRECAVFSRSRRLRKN
jgi:hypothetical protein